MTPKCLTGPELARVSFDALSLDDDVAANAIEALRAHIAALEQHVSDLDKSLENVRQERDALKANSPGFSESSPAGQVADDERRVFGALSRHDEATPYNLEALSRLAAAAKERHAALADNAALLQALLDVAELRLSGPTLNAMAAKLKTERHPGAALLEELAMLRGVRAQAQVDAKFIHEALGWAGEWPSSLPAPSRAVVALLEEHRKALVRARNEGLEVAADMAWTNDPDSELAAAIRRMKEPEE